MYEIIKNKIVHAVTIRRVVFGAIGILLVYLIGSLASGYFETRADYQRALERLEQTQNELNRSRRLNQELKLVIERSSELNRQAGDRITRIEDYQRRTEQGIGRAQNYQQETGRRVSESIGNNNRASELIGRSLRIIERVESGNKEQ